MWRPADADELHARLKAGDLEESQAFDGKRELGSDNVRIAVDLCAMTVAGGVILYGVGENSGGTRITDATPVHLEGARERLSQIAQTALAEPVTPEISTIAEPGQPGLGYVVVSIPPSVRAPHQVIVKGKYYGRFYGRDGTGNRVLTETEIAALYARREKIEINADLKLERELRDWYPLALDGATNRVCIALRARPLTGDDGLTKRAAGPPGASSVTHVLNHITGEGAKAQIGQFDPNLRGIPGHWRLEDADHWAAKVVGREDHIELAMRVRRDGQASLFGRRVGAINQSGQLVVFEQAISGLTAGFLRALGGLYQRAGYLGAVDVGVIVKPLQGAIGSIPLRQLHGRPYPTDQFVRQARVTAGQLQDDPRSGARMLVGDLMTALVGEGYDAFAEASWMPR
jgi:hypothetical protein